MLASQLHYYIIQQVLKTNPSTEPSFYGKKEVGQYLIGKIIAPGKKYLWNEMIKEATGEELTAKYFAKQFVGNNSKK